MRKYTLSKLLPWMKTHKVDLLLVSGLMLVSGLVSGLNMTGYPERFEDEGTYVSQAWAVKEKGTLAHYTYWYDHPPLGWIQIAGFFTLFDGLHRYGSAITAGREFMLILHLLTVGLLYALARRLKIRRAAAVVGVLLYALSPLAVEFSRYVFLDNVALPWLLGAFLCALSPRRSLGSAIGAAACMAIAVLSKETLLVLLPVLLYCLWRDGDKRNRRYTMTAFMVIFIMGTAFYVLYAVLKNELIPGPGHVSLLGSLYWQLIERQGSGSIFNKSSDTYGLVAYWLHIDYYLLAIGIAGLIPALLRRSLRPAGLAFLISLAMLLRSGYLPYPYVIALLPFAALCAAALVDEIIGFMISKAWVPLRFGAGILAIEAVLAAVLVVLPVWHSKIDTDMTVDADASSRSAVSWVAAYVPHSSRIVVESALWSDLEDKGFNIPKPVWLYKTETDPAVRSEIGGWRGIDYVILDGPTVTAKNFNKAFPTVSQALAHGQLLTQFGSNNQNVRIYKINS